MKLRNRNSERLRVLRRMPIRELGLRLTGSPMEPLILTLQAELRRKLRRFRPQYYLTDEWGCPSGQPVIGIPFYLADPELARIEKLTNDIENARQILMYLRHEAGHAFNYAYRLYQRPEWRATFGSFRRRYSDDYRPVPFSRDYVRHLPGWYAQKHPDEDFAETFAVWLTPGLDWRSAYAGWGALAKLEYVDKVMKQIAHQIPQVPEPSEDDLPVAAMQYTVAQHYEENEEKIPIRDDRLFDGDLRTIFVAAEQAPAAASAADFISRHKREIVTRIAYWTGENASVVCQFVDFLAERAAQLGLRLGGLEAATLIDVTALRPAVTMNYRHTNAIDGT